MVGRREPRGIGPCPPLLPPPPACRPHTPLPPLPTTLTGAADSLWRGAEGLGARARCGSPHGSRPHLCTTIHRPSTVDGHRSRCGSTQRPAAAVRRPAWRLGCPSLTDAVWSGLQEVVPLIGAGFFTLDGSLRRTLFPRARRAESENFPNARAPPGPRPRLRLGQGGPRRLLARCFGHHHRSR